MRFATNMAVLCLLLATCCREPTPPPIEPAPARLAALRIHVANATQDAARAAGEDVCANTVYLREAVQRSLVRAGYALVVSADEPRDLLAKISADWPWDKPGAAAMTLLDDAENPVDQLSGLVAFNENHDIDEASAVALVEAMSRSAKLARFAAAPPRPSRFPPLVREQMTPIDRDLVISAAARFCRAVLAGDAETVASSSALPTEIAVVTNVNMGNPVRERHVASTAVQLLALRPCANAIGLDPSAGLDRGSSFDARPVESGQWEVVTTVGRLDAILVFAPLGNRLVFTGYREQLPETAR